MADAVVYLDHDAEVGVRHGFVAAEDAAAAEVAGDVGDGANRVADDGDDEAAGATGGLPRSLVESLTAHRTAALAMTLSQQPKVALAAVVHALALRTFYGHGGDSCLQIFAKDVSLKLAEGSKAREFLEIATETWREHLPGNADDLFAWCLEQLAQCAALSVHAVQAKIDRPDTDRLVHAGVGAALSLDMATWFTPNAANFFGKLTKTGIVEALTEAREGAVAPAWLKAKKADLVNIAEREVANTGWLPAPCAAQHKPLHQTARLAADRRVRRLEHPQASTSSKMLRRSSSSCRVSTPPSVRVGLPSPASSECSAIQSYR